MIGTPSLPAPAPGADIVDGYDLARRLLAARGADDRNGGLSDVADTIERSPRHHRQRLWDGLAGEAEHHGIAPLLAPVLAALRADRAGLVPAEVALTFAALTSRHRRAGETREACIDELLDAFAAAGLTVVLLKGAALAHLIYQSPASRPMVDIDVLVPPAEARRAAAVARDCGFAFAAGFDSRFIGRMHHLPAATRRRDGFAITLEIHGDTMSRDQPEGLSLANLAEPLVPLRRGDGPAGLALGHLDMLRHLTSHAFEPARRVRLVHLYDLWRYRVRFAAEIDWTRLAARAPRAAVVLQLVDRLFDEAIAAAPDGAGRGMRPLSEIARERGVAAKIDALFNPPAWWMHGFYGVPPGKSLAFCRAVRHPVTVSRWLANRFAAGAGLSATGLLVRRPSGDAEMRS